MRLSTRDQGTSRRSGSKVWAETSMRSYGRPRRSISANRGPNHSGCSYTTPMRGSCVLIVILPWFVETLGLRPEAEADYLRGGQMHSRGRWLRLWMANILQAIVSEEARPPQAPAGAPCLRALRAGRVGPYRARR